MIYAAILVAALQTQEVEGFFGRYCVDCHGAEKPKKGLRLDVLPSTSEAWSAIHDRVRRGEMPPPKKKKQPTAAERRTILRAIAARADAGRDGRAVLRRLNRVEYQNTLRDLLGVDLDLTERLPEDASAHGFDNVGEALQASSFLMERYLETADQALDAAIANGPRPWMLKRRVDLKKERSLKPRGSVYRHLDDAVAIFSSQENANIQVNLWSLMTRFPGRYRLRVSAYGFQSGGKPVTFHLKDGSMQDTSHNRMIGYYEVPAGKPTVVEVVHRFEANRMIRLAVDGMVRPREVQRVGADKWKGPGLAVQWIHFEGPLMEWPPAGHRWLFEGMNQARDPKVKGRVEVVSKDPLADARRILKMFARRAFRRPVTEEEIEPYVARVRAKLDEGASFERALRAALKGILIAPDFLYLRERPGKLDEFALASRLSYFLWSTLPDETLLQLAERGELGKSIRPQVERMLRDPKSGAFRENFVGQWLNLRDIDFTIPDPKLYPEYTDDLKESMVREPLLFFDEVLAKDLSVTRFVDSDFTLLDENLAKLYGISGVKGRAFRKVALPPGSRRGGVMTMAAVLKVTANGTTTSPVLRGTWVLERILGTPPPKPPEDVEAVEPDIRGATTIRELLAKHRERPECASCHARIDPPGFALESFDVIGGWRTFYRSVGKGTRVRGTRYRKGPDVDPSYTLFDGRKFRDIDEYKKLLLEDPDGLARALAEKLLTYATGAAPRSSDAEEVDAIVASIRKKNYGLRSLIHAIVQSRLFRSK